jgi:hypothetical protein
MNHTMSEEERWPSVRMRKHRSSIDVRHRLDHDEKDGYKCRLIHILTPACVLSLLLSLSFDTP